MKIKLTKRMFSMFIVIYMTLASFIGCAPADNQQTKGTIKIGAVNWDDCIALTNLAQAVLQEEMGYTVKSTLADVGPVFASVASGDNDVFLDAWLPATHETYMERYGNEIDELGTIYTGARIGLVVPAYVDIESIEQLNDVKEKFNNQIIGIDAGAGVMEKTNEAINEYGLDFEVVTSSGPMMTAALKRAIDNNEWAAVTGWSPHWKFGRWDLKFLEDPKNIYGKEEYVAIVARKGLAEDLPEVAQFFSNYKISLEQLEVLMANIQDSEQEPYEVAKQWMNDNIEQVKGWIPTS